MKISFVVTVDEPQSYSTSAAGDYIRDAVRSHGGSFHPSDEFFDHFRNATVVPLARVINKLNSGSVPTSGSVHKKD